CTSPSSAAAGCRPWNRDHRRHRPADYRSVSGGIESAAMRPSPPRHLAQRRSRLDLARNRHLVLQWSSPLAVVLLVTVILANLPGGGPGSGAASGGPSGVTAGEPTPTATAGFGNPVRNWSFEQDLNGWQVIRAGDGAAVPQGPTSGACASVRA